MSREVPVDSLAVVGRSWRKRGPLYWAGRAFAAVLLSLISIMVFAMTIGITVGIIKAGAPSWVVIPLVAMASGLSTFVNARSIVRKQRGQDHLDDCESAPANARSGEGMTGGAGALGSGLSALGGIGAFLVALCIPIAVGLVPVILWYWLKPLAPGELRARRKLSRWLTIHGRDDEIPAGWRTS
ncbi:hypothetical protein ACFY2T_00695 [Streptomyces sp. NPDC001260]|uniref:hypothetical protein n=1 Tax=Streptomyces sp. NPDC001260 TaxID=3364551 RepID=UPI0036BF952F